MFKKLLFVTLALCLTVTLAFGQPLAKQNYIVEKEYKLSLLAPGLVYSGVAIWTFTRAIKIEDKNRQAGAIGVAFVLFYVGGVLLVKALTPKVTFWFPKVDEDGTVWFEKKLRW